MSPTRDELQTMVAIQLIAQRMERIVNSLERMQKVAEVEALAMYPSATGIMRRQELEKELWPSDT